MPFTYLNLIKLKSLRCLNLIIKFIYSCNKISRKYYFAIIKHYIFIESEENISVPNCSFHIVRHITVCNTVYTNELYSLITRVHECTRVYIIHVVSKYFNFINNLF